MPISERIVDEIEGMDLSNAQRNLLYDVLNVEDMGTNRYKKEYEDLIANYIKNTKGNTV